MTDQASALRQIVKNLKKQRERSNAGAWIVAVTSGKGGVGKTNFTVNFAISLCKKGLRVLVIDADFGLANVDVIMGVNSKYNLSHLIQHSRDITEIVTEGPCGVKFISGGSGIADLVDMKAEQVSRVMDSLICLEDTTDIIIVDTGAGVSPNVMQLIAASDEIIVITTPEPTAIMDAYALIKMLVRDMPGGEIEQRINLIVNKADSIAEAEDTLKKVAAVVRLYLKVDLNELGYILSDHLVSKAVRLQKPFSVAYPKSTATCNLEGISWKFLEWEKESSSGLKKFFERLFRKEKSEKNSI